MLQLTSPPPPLYSFQFVFVHYRVLKKHINENLKRLLLQPFNCFHLTSSSCNFMTYFTIFPSLNALPQGLLTASASKLLLIFSLSLHVPFTVQTSSLASLTLSTKHLTCSVPLIMEATAPLQSVSNSECGCCNCFSPLLTYFRQRLVKHCQAMSPTRSSPLTNIHS